MAQLQSEIMSRLEALFDAWGWLAVALLMAFENLTGITPSEVILGLAGWLLIAAHEHPPAFILMGSLFASLGSVLGASGAYWTARIGGRPLVDRMASWVRIQPAQVARTEQLFLRWGTAMVLFGRVIPGIRTLVSIPAGLARMNFLKFVLATFIGTFVWCSLLIGAGYLLGHEWHLIAGYLKQGFPYLLAAGLLALALFALLTRSKLSPVLNRSRDQEE